MHHGIRELCIVYGIGRALRCVKTTKIPQWLCFQLTDGFVAMKEWIYYIWDKAKQGGSIGGPTSRDWTLSFSRDSFHFFCYVSSAAQRCCFPCDISSIMKAFFAVFQSVCLVNDGPYKTSIKLSKLTINFRHKITGQPLPSSERLCEISFHFLFFTPPHPPPFSKVLIRRPTKGKKERISAGPGFDFRREWDGNRGGRVVKNGE